MNALEQIPDVSVKTWYWEKLGNIFDPSQHRDWAGSHAQVPTVLVLSDRLRIFYADRDANGRSFPTFLDVDRDEPTKVLYCQKTSVMAGGAPGTFDDEGLMPAWVHSYQGKVWMYYSGWNRRVSVPYHNSTGLGVSVDQGLSFQRVYEGPIMDRTPAEPYLAVTPWVVREEHGDSTLWRSWYISGLRWDKVGDKYEPVYVIKCATSQDGHHWHRPNIQCVEQLHPQEAFSHPTVLLRNGRYHMWYCYRHSVDYRDGGGSYRIGYATSENGENFVRNDAASGIEASETGWDAKMICYPSVVEVGDATYMFYNGNGFGQSGIGVAILRGEIS